MMFFLGVFGVVAAGGAVLFLCGWLMSLDDLLP